MASRTGVVIAALAIALAACGSDGTGTASSTTTTRPVRLATGIAVDKYLLGVRPGGFDERVRLEQKIQKDLAIRRKADKAAKINIRVSTADGIRERSFDGLNHKDASDQLWKLISYPYVGKGSPEGLQALLQLATVELPGSPALVKPANFQSYCSKWLGLDCNGLVGNFLRHIYSGIVWWDFTTTDSGLDPNKDIKVIWDAFGGTERKTAADTIEGYLWRLNTYCWFDARTEGVYEQCESISLTREPPFGVGWLVKPFVTSIPRETLEATLGAVRNGVLISKK